MGRGGLVRSAPGDCSGGCYFPEVVIGKDDASELLPQGTKVMAPCSNCGQTALEGLNWLDNELANNRVAFALYLSNQLLPLFHWAPRSRRGQIIRFGLRPSMRPSTHVDDLTKGWRAPYVCLADTPKWAWALSGGFRPAGQPGEWDLWSTTFDKLTEPWVEPAHWSNGIHEVRTKHRIFKRDLWLVGSR